MVRAVWAIQFVALAAAALASIAIRRLRNRQMAVLWLAVVSYTGVHMLFYVIFRYREPNADSGRAGGARPRGVLSVAGRTTQGPALSPTRPSEATAPRPSRRGAMPAISADQTRAMASSACCQCSGLEKMWSAPSIRISVERRPSGRVSSAGPGHQGLRFGRREVGTGQQRHHLTPEGLQALQQLARQVGHRGIRGARRRPVRGTG
jgi:hypothetical protein